MFSKLKKYSLDELLLFIGEYSREMFEIREPIRQIKYYRKLGKYKVLYKMHIAAWDLVDLSYYSVKFTSNYRDKNIDLLKFYELINEYRCFNEEKDEGLRNISNEKAPVYIFYSLSQKQFWYQESYNNIEIFNRNYEILINMKKQIESKIDIHDIINKEIGVSTEKYINILIFIFGIGLRKIDITEEIFNDDNLRLFKCSKEEVNKFLDYYSSDYYEIRESKLEENHFLTKPIIKIKPNRFIIVNTFLLLRLLADGLYWVVRNYYFKSRSQLFINEFGIYFENYVEQLFKDCLVQEAYYKIDESGSNKKADWVVEFEDYIFIIEQKSMLASIMIKKQYPDLQDLLNYIFKYEEAFDQLNSSEEEKLESRKDKTIIKLILHYDSLYGTELIKNEIVKKRNYLNQDNNIYFINIRELEILMYLYKNCKEDFNKVMKEKLKREVENAINGKGFDIILRDLNLNKNDYINRYKNNFDKCMNNLAE